MKEPLWAPWRIGYILGPKNHSRCVFCDYAGHGPEHFREDLTLVADDRVLVTLNRYPFAAGHLMVMPRAHVADLSELSPEDYDHLFRMVGQAASRLRAAVKAEGLNVGINLGAAAGAGIADHLHVHVVPRWQGDTNFMPVLADVRVMPQALDETWKHLYPHFRDLPGQRADEP
ncbi:MAG: HIT domain-containing protein [Polyangiaceae bacterium]|jgi:ATP adenylyltransferase|nr:HIT domain-containing protein [Polyangiaceae bacterium]